LVAELATQVSYLRELEFGKEVLDGTIANNGLVVGFAVGGTELREELIMGDTS
jgi:hypothetical protein